MLLKLGVKWTPGIHVGVNLSSFPAGIHQNTWNWQIYCLFQLKLTKYEFLATNCCTFHALQSKSRLKGQLELEPWSYLPTGKVLSWGKGMQNSTRTAQYNYKLKSDSNSHYPLQIHPVNITLQRFVKSEMYLIRWIYVRFDIRATSHHLVRTIYYMHALWSTPKRHIMFVTLKLCSNTNMSEYNCIQH